MPDDLIHYIARLIEDGRQNGLSADEIADILWMARYLRPSAVVEAGPLPDASTVIPEPSVRSGMEPTAGREIDQVRHEVPASAPSSDVEFHPFPSQRTSAAADGRRAVSVRVPAVAALPNALEISRALRPLNRRVPRPDTVVLAEEATSAVFGETKLILPVWRPATERWLQVDLVVDISNSMVIWQHTAAELRVTNYGVRPS